MAVSPLFFIVVVAVVAWFLFTGWGLALLVRFGVVGGDYGTIVLVVAVVAVVNSVWVLVLNLGPCMAVIPVYP